MILNDIVRRNMAPKPWEEGEKIPWSDPDFSRRMLKEHLTQEHDAASRRTPTIKKHVRWIHKAILLGEPSRILDLGCGPGLYTSSLTAFGHECRGIDFSPASIAYAKKHAPDGCSYTLADVRTAEFGSGYDLVMFIYGELNVFKASDTRKILEKAWKALKPDGRILLEISTYNAIEQIGNQPSTWYSSSGGLFSDTPHLCLMESFWNEAKSIATERYYIVDLDSGDIYRYASSSQAYDEKSIKSILQKIGFKKVQIHPSLTGVDEIGSDDFMVVTAIK
jgi:ubiquinone/menaquinone biosynthesis C-methylase UbiE